MLNPVKTSIDDKQCHPVDKKQLYRQHYYSTFKEGNILNGIAKKPTQVTLQSSWCYRARVQSNAIMVVSLISQHVDVIQQLKQ